MPRFRAYYGTFVQLLASIVFTACGSSDTDRHNWDPLPSGVRLNEQQSVISVADVALGRALFRSPALSSNGQISCATCHPESGALQDGLQFSAGVTGEALQRNTPTLYNIGWAGYLTWSNVAFFELEQHMTVPLFGDSPPEMFAKFDVRWLRSQVAQDSSVVATLAEHPKFGSVEELDWPQTMNLIARYMRSLSSFDSPWDDAQQGGPPLSAAAVAGQSLFFSQRLGCSSCHVPPMFSTAYRLGEGGRPSVETAFANNGLYFVEDTESGYPDGDPGLMEFTGKIEDGGRFRIPSLRNVEFTAPYMHDGSIPTLEGVIDHYAAGGRRVLTGPNRGDGSQHPNRDPRIRGFSITPREREQLLAFLRSLSGAQVRFDVLGNSSTK